MRALFAVLLLLVGLLPASLFAQKDPQVRANEMIAWAWADMGNCKRVGSCILNSGFASGDGWQIPIERITTSAHDMVVWAKAARNLGYPNLAVSILAYAWWPHNQDEARFIVSHPDEAITSLDAVNVYNQSPCEWARAYSRTIGWPIPPLCSGR